MPDVMTRPRFSAADYGQLLESARALLAETANATLSVGELVAQMLETQSAQKIAQDTDLRPGAVLRFAKVATFWNGVRIGPNQAGRPAIYALYDRVALDPLMTDEEKQEIRRHARRGRHVVESMVTEFRARHATEPPARASVARQALNGLQHAEQRLSRVQPGDVDGRTLDEMQALVETMAGHVDLLKATTELRSAAEKPGLTDQVWYRLQDQALLDSPELRASIAAWKAGDVSGLA